MRKRSAIQGFTVTSPHGCQNNPPCDEEMNSTPTSSPPQSVEELQDEVAELERKLQEAKARLNSRSRGQESSPTSPLTTHEATTVFHNLLLLSDSALPLGSFAFSSGLESFLAHTRVQHPSSSHAHTLSHNQQASFNVFLNLSISSYASATLPFVLAAYRCPQELLDLDDALDAAIMCTVGRRASVAQGRALLGVWERSLSGPGADSTLVGQDTGTVDALKEMSMLVRKPSNPGSDLPLASAHLPPLFGALSRLLGLSLQQTSYIYLLSHIKALLSAAVRASIFGPYQAQKILASGDVQEGIRRAVEVNKTTEWWNAGQVVPVLDIWVGRHEVLYSRIFNS